MFHCFTLTICLQQHILMHCASVTLSDNNCWQWWGSKMSLNHVEPCWTLPLRNTTFDCLERPCSNTAPASATSDPGDASNSATCRKKESAWRIRRYCNAKTWHFAMTMHCINAYQAYHLFRVVFSKLFWWGWNSRHMVLDVLVLGHFETQSWLIPTRSFSNPLSPRLRLDHRLLCCLQRIKVRNGRQHPRSRRVLLRLILHLPALRLQFGQVSLLQRLAFAINHPPSQEPRVIPRARGDGESHAVHRRRRGWIHGSDAAGAMSTISWAKVSPGDWGQWWTPCDESEPIAATTKLSCRKVSAGSAKKSENSCQLGSLQLRTGSAKNWLGPSQVTTTCWSIMKIHEICWILDIDESDSTAIFGAKWPNPPLASQVSLGFFSSNSGKAPKNGRLSRPALCCDFSVQNVPPGRVWVEKLCYESFHDLQKLWQAIKSIEAAAS